VAIKNSSQKVRFTVIGGINTVIDFGVLFLLKSLGLPVIPANIVSTSCAFCFSFFANRKYTFKTRNSNIKREIILFILVTLFGLWVLQGIGIHFITIALSNTHWPDAVILLVAKLCASVASLTWNYILYSRVVFKQHEPQDQPE
jgi:putative flippase GtrA